MPALTLEPTPASTRETLVYLRGELEKFDAEFQRREERLRHYRDDPDASQARRDYVCNEIAELHFNWERDRHPYVLQLMEIHRNAEILWPDVFGAGPHLIAAISIGGIMQPVQFGVLPHA